MTGENMLDILERIRIGDDPDQLRILTEQLESVIFHRQSVAQLLKRGDALVTVDHQVAFIVVFMDLPLDRPDGVCCPFSASGASRWR